MKVSELLETLSEKLGWKAATPAEGLLTGAPDTTIRGIAACGMPSVDVLRQAIATGRNLILCDGHPFYLYDRYARDMSALRNTPQMAVKRKIIEEAGLAIVRIHSAWQTAKPASAARSLAVALGLTPTPDTGRSFVTCEVATTIGGLARHIRTDGVRLIGDPRWPVSRVAVLPGMASPTRLGAALRDPAIDAVIAGEVIEWEGGPYMIDVQGTGRRCGLLLTGFANSMDPDAAALADWARDIFAGVPVDALRNDGNFIWSVKGGRA